MSTRLNDPLASASYRAEFARDWKVLVGSTLGCTVGIASIYFYSVGLFIRPLQQEFGWGRATLSGGGVAASIALALFSPLAGRLTDRFGARRVAGTSLGFFALGLLALSAVTNSLLVYFAITIITAVLAAGCSPLVFAKPIAAAFDKARGLALGITISGTGIGGALVPMLLTPFIAIHGWRAAYIALAIVVACSLPVALLLLANSGSGSVVKHREAQPGSDLNAAVRTATFWQLVVMLGFGGLGVTGVAVHMMPFLLDHGVTPARAGVVVGLVGIAIIMGRLITGFLIDRFHAGRVGGSILALGAIGCLALIAGGPAMAPATALLVGSAMGTEGDLMGYVVSRYFGLRAFGAILGWLYCSFLIGAAIGPLMAGAVYDAVGAYSIAIGCACVALAIASAAAFSLRAYPALGDGHNV